MDTNSRKIKIVNSFLISTLVAVAFVAIITVWSELYHPLKDWLKNTFGHHWVGKGVLAACIYIILGGLLTTLIKPGSDESTRKLLTSLLWVIILGFALVSGFYVYEAFFVVH